MARKSLVLAITLVQVIGFGSLIGWRVAEWNRTGWAGFAYHVDTSTDDDRPQPAFFWGADPRRVEMVVPGGPADRAGIAVGDTVESVNGVAVGEVDELRALAAAGRTGDEMRYRVSSGGATRDVVVELESPYRLPVVIAATAASVIAGLVFVLISMLVYWSRPKSAVSVLFFLMCVFGACEYLVWAAIEFDLPSLRGIMPSVVEPFVFLGLAVVGFFAVGLVNLLLHLSLVFPRPRPVLDRGRGILVWLHTVPYFMVAVGAVMAGALYASRVWWGSALAAAASVAVVGLCGRRLWVEVRADGPLAALRGHPFVAQGVLLALAALAGLALRPLPVAVGSVILGVVFGLIFVVGLICIVVYSVMVVVAMYRSYRESGIDEKRQLRWPLWGTLTAVGVSVVLLGVSLLLSLSFGRAGHIDFTSNAVLTAASKMVYLLIPISFAFGIVKYRLLEIDLIIRRTVVYSLVTGIILVVYLVLAGVSGLALVRSAGLESQAATVVATLLVVALFVPVRNRIQRLVDRVFSRRERDTEASIGRITETVMQSTSLEDLALGVAEEVQRALGVRTVSVLVRRAGGDTIAAAATVGLPDRAAAHIRLASTSPVFRSSSTHVTVDRDPLEDGEREVLERAAAERAIICRRGDDPVGMITVGRKLSREGFDDEDEVFLEAVAGQLTIGLGRLRGRRAELEFTQALQIQRSLLPSEIPQIPGFDVAARWTPAREVSGDYFDVLPLGEQRLALCIGDVVGKGMPAALLMSSVQAATKAVATTSAGPSEVCHQVRSVVTSNLTGGKFVTFFYAVIDGAARTMRYTNCGHNQPVLVRRDGTAVRLERGGPAFARLMRDLPYESGDVEMRAGDRLVLFTDGVSEASDPDGVQLGEDRLVELVIEHREKSAAELEARIASTVLDHADGELQDDLTMVVVAVE